MKILLLNKKIFFLIILISFLESCSSSPRFLIKDKNENEFGFTTNNDVLETQIGIASYYADQFNGKVTYSGEIYNMFGLSAAHPFYQMGTIIRVTNLSNGKSVVIPINDRMPYRSDRIIDLSLGTAQKLDMINVGITEVKVEVLKWGNGKK
ncbi:MAG: septal ring lytic transglycosylase RlpA family protein [Melioribacteraceae bacterium]|nr:septal ring lytic transglycosylase RlpA family protein [Melioribacteraceae bacterium]